MAKDFAIFVYDTMNVPIEKYCDTVKFIKKVAKFLRHNLSKAR